MNTVLPLAAISSRSHVKCVHCRMPITEGVAYNLTSVVMAMVGIPGDYIPDSRCFCSLECLKRWIILEGNTA